jgi:hypothetical protein
MWINIPACITKSISIANNHALHFKTKMQPLYFHISPLHLVFLEHPKTKDLFNRSFDSTGDPTAFKDLL